MSLPTRKTCALLAYLAVNADRRQSRDQLATLLWGDRGERQARQSLSHALRSIRRLDTTSDTTILENDGEHITLRSDAMDIDVIRFHVLFETRPADAAALYGGAFLDGLAIPSQAFEEWLAITRTHLHDLACDALQRAADAEAAAGNGKEAIDTAKRMVRLDPIRESGHQLLIRLLCEHGDRASALRQYQVCADILQKELGVEPGPATQALRDSILKNPPNGQIEDVPQTADAPPFRSMPIVAPRQPARGRVAAFVTSALILFGVTLVPWQLSWIERTEPIPQLPTVTALPDKPIPAAIAERRFANILERDAWYASATQAVEQVFYRRLGSQYSDWDTLDCDKTTTLNARLICKDIAFEIQRLTQQKTTELDLLRKELAVAVVLPPAPLVPKSNMAMGRGDVSVPPDTHAETEIAATEETVAPSPVAKVVALPDGTTHNEFKDGVVFLDEELGTPPDTMTRVAAIEKSPGPDTKPKANDRPEGLQSNAITNPSIPASVGNNQKVKAERNGPHTSAQQHETETRLEKRAIARQLPSEQATFGLTERKQIDVPSERQAAQPTSLREIQTSHSRTSLEDPASRKPSTDMKISRSEIERYWRERIEAMKREGRYKDCELSLDYDWTTIGECPDRSAKIREYSEALKSGRLPVSYIKNAIGDIQTRAEIERYWRERIEAVKAEGPYKDCSEAVTARTDAGYFRAECKERAERIERYTAALKAGSPFLNAREAMMAKRRSRAEIERYWKERIEAVKSEGRYEDCDPLFRGTGTSGGFGSDSDGRGCWARAEKIKLYSKALKEGRPSFFDPNAAATLQVRRQPRAEIERYWRERIEAVKSEGRYEECWKSDWYAFEWAVECRERAKKIAKYSESLKKLEPYFDPNEAKATLLAHTKSRAAFERYVRQRVRKLKDEGPYKDCRVHVFDLSASPTDVTDCEERGEEIQKLWTLLYTGKAPGKFAIARASERPELQSADLEADRKLLRQAIVAFYLNQGYSNEPGPISDTSAGISEMQIKSMQLREIDGTRVTVATEYDAETQDDFESFSLASEFTLEKQDGVYRVVGHDPLGNQM